MSRREFWNTVRELAQEEGISYRAAFAACASLFRITDEEPTIELEP